MQRKRTIFLPSSISFPADVKEYLNPSLSSDRGGVIFLLLESLAQIRFTIVPQRLLMELYHCYKTCLSHFACRGLAAGLLQRGTLQLV